MNGNSSLAEKTARLLTFLAELQAPPGQTAGVGRSSKVHDQVGWVYGLPRHPSIRFEGLPGSDTPLLRVKQAAPEVITPPDFLIPYLDSSWDDPGLRPHLTTTGQFLAADEYEDWIPEWEEWAKTAHNVASAQEVHDYFLEADNLIRTRRTPTELVFAFGLMSWRQPNRAVIQQHLFTVPLDIHLDDVTGEIRLHLTRPASEISEELSLLDADLYSADLPGRFRQAIASLGDVQVDGELIHELGYFAAQQFSRSGSYLPTMEIPAPSSTPVVSASPAFVLRERQIPGAATALQTIAARTRESATVSSGLHPLVDPRVTPLVPPPPDPAAVLSWEASDEPFFPMSLNERQERVLSQADRHAQSVVQGAAGTGKTYTAAALATHFLFQGKRLLVTTPSDESLAELRDHLPSDFRRLSISLSGDSTGSINEFLRMVRAHDLVAASDDIAQLNEAIRERKASRATAYEHIADARRRESETHTFGTFSGTRTELASSLNVSREEYSWLDNYAPDHAPSQPPLTGDEATELLRLLNDDDLNAVADDWGSGMDITLDIPSAEEFADKVATAQTLRDALDDESISGRAHQYANHMSNLNSRQVAEIDRAIQRFLNPGDSVPANAAAWEKQIYHDITQEGRQKYEHQLEQLRALAGQLDSLIRKLGDHSVEISGDAAVLEGQATALLAYLAGGPAIRTDREGNPKFTWRTPQAVKDAQTFLTSVRVDGRPPVTVEAIELFFFRLQLQNTMAEADALQSDLRILNPFAPLAVRLEVLDETIESLTTLLKQAQPVESLIDLVRRHGVPDLPFTDPTEMEFFRRGLELRFATLKSHQAQAPLDDLADTLSDELATREVPSTWLVDICRAVYERNVDGYRNALDLRETLDSLHADHARRELLLSRLRNWNRALAEDLQSSASDPLWQTRFRKLENALDWWRAHDFLSRSSGPDESVYRERIRRIDDELRQAPGTLGALHAHRHAGSRWDAGTESGLRQLLELLAASGNADEPAPVHQSAEVRQALNTCLPDIPALFLTFKQVVTLVEMQEHIFDVVIVDDATQLGSEALLLQYLAPQIIVLGDDQRISPVTTDIEASHVQELASQYLTDIPHRDVLCDLNRSYFDDANMRFAGKTTLIEQYRTAPGSLKPTSDDTPGLFDTGTSHAPERSFAERRTPPSLFGITGWGDEEPTLFSAVTTDNPFLSDPAQTGASQPSLFEDHNASGHQGPESEPGLDNEAPEPVVPDSLTVLAYREFDGELPDILSSPMVDVREGLIGIIEAEGPAVGNHLAKTYARSSGNRLTKATKSKLRKAIYSAVSQQLIVEVAEDDAKQVLQRTYRMPFQEDAVVRTRGSREFDVIPRSELREVGLHLIEHSDSAETVLHKLAAFYGIIRLSSKTREIFQPIVDELVGGPSN